MGQIPSFTERISGFSKWVFLLSAFYCVAVKPTLSYVHSLILEILHQTASLHDCVGLFKMQLKTSCLSRLVGDCLFSPVTFDDCCVWLEMLHCYCFTLTRVVFIRQSLASFSCFIYFDLLAYKYMMIWDAKWLTVTYFVSCTGGCKFHKFIEQVEYIHHYSKQNNVISYSTSHFISIANLVLWFIISDYKNK